MTGWSTGEVERSEPFCLRHKTNRKEGIQTKPDKRQRRIRCTNPRKRLPQLYKPPTPEMLAYLDFSVSTTGMLTGVKVE